MQPESSDCLVAILSKDKIKRELILSFLFLEKCPKMNSILIFSFEKIETRITDDPGYTGEMSTLWVLH